MPTMGYLLIFFIYIMGEEDFLLKRLEIMRKFMVKYLNEPSLKPIIKIIE